jgi:RNA-directed DNA polymerase
MNGREKSDRSVRAKNSPNKAPERAAEAGEQRDLAKGKPPECNTARTQSRPAVLNALERVREAASKDRKQRFTALLHHVYDVTRLRIAYGALRPEAAAGVDGETWGHYGQNLEGNLLDLSERLKRGAYRAKPTKRAYIPKADGRQRPIGVPALEDKIVQRAVVEVLNAIYEGDFVGFSYGFRPGRRAHDALDALTTAIKTKKVNWVLDADIRSFFDTLKHEWLVKFVEHRVADRRVVRLIQKWLNAGVLEDGKRTVSEVGTVQGGSVSPLLANVYLHYVFDLWANDWRKKRARGELIVVRYADDFVVGFEHREDGERFWADLRERFTKFGLELHAGKTDLIEFGRHAAGHRSSRGEGAPKTFNFLGFTHCCGKTRRGKFQVIRRTISKRLQAKVSEVRTELRRRMHDPVPKQGAYLRAVVQGHVRYYGVPTNSRALNTFRFAIGGAWRQTLNRRSQRGRVALARFERLCDRWLPPARVCHPWPEERFRVTTRGKSRMR